MATVNIGNIKLNWKGAYNGSTAYAIDDVVSYNGSSYVCIQASTGNLPTVTAYWEQMSAKGVDADLINITGTVQGDLYYNNGSAIARLAPGSASQVLQSGGSGANPSWTTMSSDVVKLTSGSITSSTSELVMDNLFSTTYRAYKFIFTDFSPTTMNARISYQYRIGTTNQTSQYYAGGRIFYFNGSSSDGNFSETAAANGRIGNWGISNTALNAGQYEILMSDPKSTRSVKQMWYNNSNPRETDSYYSGQWGFSQWRDASAVDGIRWFCSSGNIGYANYAVYGFKH
jgi:hypothetical protein